MSEPDGSERAAETGRGAIAQDVALRAQVKKLLKFGGTYAASLPLAAPSSVPADFADDAALETSREIDFFRAKAKIELDEIRDALRRDVFPIPHSTNREAYASGRDLSYWVSGYSTYRMLVACAAKYGVSGGRCFDFGGSTGRVFRNFAIQSDAWDVWACDFKPTSIDFVTKYLPGKIKCFLNTSIPSLPLPDGYFDFVYALSVFTHINEAETSWLLELRRILKVGGVACISILNDATWPNMAPTLRRTLDKFRPDIAGEAALPEGKTVITFRDDDPYNCNVLHSNTYIHGNWGRFFEICELQPMALNTQALVVCRRPD